MDLSKFTNKSRTAPTESAGFLKKNYYRVKYWILPPTSDRRKERLAQYRDLSFFIGSIILVSVFEEKIKNFLEIETDDIRKLTEQGLW